MDCKSLMIGDWVRLEYKNPNTGDLIRKDFQVDQIVKPWRDEPHDVWSKENGNMGEVAYIEPIPLTAEILEKNGFIEEEYGWRKLNAANWCININIFNGKERYALSVLGINAQVTLHGYYVHELQHALKLCGIDKTIEI